MENNKYYTPSIEEFFVGFECEIFNANSEWYPIQFTIGHYAELAINKDQRGFTANTGEYRVKCLDKEDIESLGFEYYMYPDIYRNKNKIEIQTWRGNMGVGMRIVDRSNGLHDHFYSVLFKGEVKNKSELVRLLKMIGVL
ncbi:MAG: hypothetical protein ACRCXN_11690 [Bacteroidales bacterium]